MTTISPPLRTRRWQVAPAPSSRTGQSERSAEADHPAHLFVMGQQSAASILVPLDLTSCSRPAMDYALELAAPSEASLVLLHIVERPCSGWPFHSSGGRDFPEAVTRRAWQQLDALAASARQRGLLSRCVVRDGVPAFEILRLAENLAVTLIVLGRSARGPLNRIVFGSVLREVVEASCCPVLVVPTPAASLASD